MTVEKKVRVMAGTMVLLGMGLGWYVSPYFFLIDLFVGLNLIQSAFTGFCPAEKILG